MSQRDSARLLGFQLAKDFPEGVYVDFMRIEFSGDPVNADQNAFAQQIKSCREGIYRAANNQKDREPRQRVAPDPNFARSLSGGQLDAMPVRINDHCAPAPPRVLGWSYRRSASGQG